MTISKRVFAGSVALATVGLSTCNNGGVDPAPPPLECSDVAGGSSLDVGTATLTNGLLHVELLQSEWQATWGGLPVVANVVGGTLLLVSESNGKVTVEIQLDVPAPASGSFELSGDLTDGALTCPVTRTFTFTINGPSVEVARVDLPLGDRRHAEIVVEGRDGHEVTLGAAGAGAGKLAWSAAHGDLRVDGGQARWRLPRQPGLYQVELVVERDNGLSIDTLTVEVT